MGHLFKEFKNFNGVSFMVNKNLYIYENYSNNLLKVDPIVEEIIDDSFQLGMQKIIQKYKPKFPVDKIKKAVKEINGLKNKKIISNFKFSKMSISNTKSTLEKVKEELKTNITKLIFNVTENCNLRCRYCVYSGSYKNRRAHNKYNDIPWEIGRKAIDFFLKHNRNSEERYISFYGGEPFIRFDFIKQAIDYTRRLDPSVIFSITSNGTLINDKMLHFLSDSNLRLTISLDGPAFIQNKNRIFLDGKGTFNRVINTIQFIKEKYPEYYENYLSLNATLVPFEGDYNTLDRFFNVSNFSFLKDEIKFSLGLLNSEENTYIKEENYYDFVKHFLKYAYTKYKVYHTDDKDQSEFLVEKALLSKKIKIFHYRSHRKLSSYSFFWPNGTCIPGMRSLFVSKNGDFYPCEKLYDYQEMCIGNVDSGLDFDIISKYLDEYSETLNDFCKNCWAYRLCGECFLSITERNSFNLKKRLNFCKSQKSLERNRNAFNYLDKYEETIKYAKFMMED